MDYIPATEKDIGEMLNSIGVGSINDLLKEFNPAFTAKLNLPQPKSEIELINHMKSLADTNKLLRYFVGAGAYDHYIPSAVSHLLARGDLFTGYTPYQAEMSQGTLQAIYEFQSFICLLTGMDVANASLYEGASALAEAALLSCSYTGRDRIFIKERLHPQYLEVLETYCEGAELKLTDKIDENTACVIAQNPDFHGNIENLHYLADQAHRVGALFTACIVEPTSLAILEPPGKYGADIVAGEGQSFGIPLSFGGPYLGFIAVKDFLLKRLPGRICGMTTDSRGNSGFVLTFQAREQHIRRERATSNITTNQALNALAATIYLALLGRSGLTTVAKISYSRAHLLKGKLERLGFRNMNSKPFYNEFIVKAPGSAEAVASRLLKKGILGGVNLGEDNLLICCTEKNSLQDIDDFISAVMGE
ncbi:MAG TPA: aminomethyl-transferring glycine dehydrogenase subunit GcvPA [Nitrososphaera sp.]|nr:aminomethyl-transferring glycine dehydrogenase subunit GcvPA [Nitrososphaera sp.]HEX2170482.1 aminomethyl-transferring glycine dehydrogenase subunit GcvPA [Nitrososphaera sp.]